jgi:uncharacterized protein (DUF1015 family)
LATNATQLESSAPTPALLPFRGVRFDPGRDDELIDTLGPPADVDTSEDARAFVRGKPYNAVRLEIEDNGKDLSFSTARQLLRDWLASGILRQDRQPSYYLYEQQFDDRGQTRVRRGIFGLAPLDLPEVCILPHEETWEENRQRRLHLLQALDTAVSPVFLIYEGDAAATASFLGELARRPPTIQASDAGGNEHRLWVVSDPREIERLQHLVSGRHFIIADGHHRFAAAQLLHAARQTPHTGFVLACCVEAHDPGIVIRPIHRLIHGRDDIDLLSATGTLATWFDMTTAPVGTRSAHDLVRDLPAGDFPAAGVLSNGGQTITILRLRDWAAVASLLPDDIASAARELDVTVITELVIRRALQLDPTSGDAITYDDDPTVLLASVREASAGLGILMRPMRLQQVLAVARAHGRVPAKSTSFVPKIPAGLVMHAFGRDGDERSGDAYVDARAETPASHVAPRSESRT